MRFVTVFIVLAALSGQLDASPPLAPPTDGGLPALQPDGSYQQTIKLQGDQQQGWASLRRAFHSRTVAVTCPGSPGVHLTATVHAKHVGEEVNASSMPLLKHPWRRRMQCTPSAEGSNCSAALPAAGLAALQLRLQGTAAGGSLPQPCKVTVQAALAPLLLLRCLLGVWVLLFAHRALATRPGQAALRLCNAAAQAAAPWKRQLRAALAVEAVGVAVLAFLRDHIDDWPAEGRKLASAGKLVCFGAMTLAGLGILAIAVLAARAARTRPRPWHGGAFAFAAPFLLQLLGAALIDSNSKELNWAARLAAFFCWLLLLRPRFLSEPAVSGSSLEQHRRDTGAASVTSPARWREQAEALQRQLMSGLEEVTSSRRRRAKPA